MPKMYSQELVALAKKRFFEGRSLQAIADECIPRAKNGRMTIFRWKEKYGWDDERREVEDRQKAQFDDEFATVAVRLAKEHLVLARKARKAIELTLDAYFIEDPSTGDIRIRTHPKTGLPVIPAIALASLIEKVTDLERRSLGLNEVIPRAELEHVASRPVEVREADPELLREFGRYLALKAAGVDDERGLQTLDRQSNTVGGSSALTVPEGDDPLSGGNDVHVALEPSSGVVDAIALPLRSDDDHLQSSVSSGEFSGAVNSSGPTTDDDTPVGQ